jgi:hypothetical protein
MYDMARPSSRVNARLRPALARKLALVHRRTGKSVSEIVSESLERYCDASLAAGEALEAFENAGFLASGTGPRDLSSNYKDYLADSLAKKS